MALPHDERVRFCQLLISAAVDCSSTLIEWPLPTPEHTGINEKATKAANSAVSEVREKKRKGYISFSDIERAGMENTLAITTPRR